MNKINSRGDGDTKERKRLSLIVDPGACGNVADPRGTPGHPLKATHESRNGYMFVIAFGDPILQLGEEESLYIEGEF